MAEGGPPNTETQKQIISEYLKASVKKDEIWYLVDVRWFKQWKKYVCFESWESYNGSDPSANPGPIDNSGLLQPNSSTLKEHLVDEMDYALLHADAYAKLESWYGLTAGQEPIKRKAIEQGMFVKHHKVEVYFMELKLCENGDTTKHVTHAFSRSDTIASIEKEMRRIFRIPDEREVRLWNRYMSNTYENLSNKDATLQDAGLYQGQIIVIEVKNEDGSWPRQARSFSSTYSSSNFASTSTSTRTVGFSSGASASSSSASSAFDSLSSSQSSSSSTSGTTNNTINSGSGGGSGGGSGSKYTDSVSSYYASNGYDRNPQGGNKPGLCGLANLGNTCFMNSALQCMSNVNRLTEYMLSNQWEEELNKDNPLGMRGEIAISYNDLIRDIWSGTRAYTVPRNFKIAVGHFAPQFSGYQQQDSQELMAFLLDGLHEDLNRIRQKPYIELKDSGGRPDLVVAKEAWDNYKKRNDSIIVDIFHGLLKSTVQCPDCQKISVTFDPFCYLSLPLPIKKERQMEVFWIPLSPEKWPMQIRLVVPKTGCIGDLCKALAALVDVPADKMIVTDVYNHRFHKMFNMEEGVNHILDRDDIFVYEIPHSNIEDADDMIVPVYLRDKKYSVRHLDQNSVSSQPLFGHPMLLAVPKKGCTYDMLYQLLLERMTRYVTVPSSLDDWQEEGQEETSEDSGNSGHGSDNNDGDEHGDNNKDSDNDNSDHRMELASDGGSNSSNNKMESASHSSNMKMDATSTAGQPGPSSSRKKRIFTLRAVNNFGRDETGTVLVDDDQPLRITSRTCIAVDWGKASKDAFFNEKAAEDFEEHDSMRARVGQKRACIQLDDCLKLFMKAEQLSENDPWYCPDCKEHQQASKKFDLWSLPDVLIIQLKRFQYNKYWRDKIDVLVQFPTEGLDLRKYIINKESNVCDLYDLIAVTNHYGGLGGGHYTAYAQNKDDKNWYYFDDSSVSSTTADATNTKAAYVLVYQRRNLQNQKYPASSSLTLKDQKSSETSTSSSSGPSSKFATKIPHVEALIPNGVGAASGEDDMDVN